MREGVENRGEIEMDCGELKHVMAFPKGTVVTTACVTMPLQYRHEVAFRMRLRSHFHRKQILACLTMG